jgi:energy-converting hydrogenase Eha subunit C
MLKPVQKLILAMMFCLLDGMVIGGGLIALDYGDIKFGITVLLGSLVTSIVLICYIVTVFKMTWIESRRKHEIEQIINLSHFD